MQTLTRFVHSFSLGFTLFQRVAANGNFYFFSKKIEACSVGPSFPRDLGGAHLDRSKKKRSIVRIRLGEQLHGHGFLAFTASQ